MQFYWASATLCILSYVCSAETSRLARLLDEDRADSGKPSMSSEWSSGHSAKKCTDGNRNTYCYNKRGGDDEPFFMIEYSKPVMVNQVTLIAAKSYPQHAKNIMVIVTNDPKSSEKQFGSTFKGPATKGERVINFQPKTGMMGKYVIVKQQDKGVITFAEVQINPPDPGEPRCKGVDSGCCTEEFPCVEDDGDCDNDDQCQGDLECGSDNCHWGDGDDCCFKKGGPCRGIDSGCCTEEFPCKVNDGDCDNDDQCQGDLVCGSNNCAWGDGDDCCQKDPGCQGGDSCCTKEKPCIENHGDCDNNDECAEGLYCGTNNCAWGDNDDCCFSINAEYKENIANAIKSTLANPPSTRDTTSKRSKIIQDLPNTLGDLGGDIITKNADFYKDVIEDLFLKIVANPKLEDYFPNFSSAFQKMILPMAIQNEDMNSALLKATLKTPFPKAVEDSAKLENKEVTIDGTYVDNCRFSECYNANWFSTDLYAKQGQLVTVTIPEDLVGKFAIRIGSHTDEVLSKNKKRWMKGQEFYRPYCIVQYYGKDMIKKKTRLLTPYGGLIYIDCRAPCKLGTFKLNFENVITSPRFKQGETTKNQWSQMLSSSQSPMVELEVPGVIVTLPRSYVDEENLNMEQCSNEYTKMMKAFMFMQGYQMPRPHRYVYDVAISLGGAHSGYPIVDASFWSEMKQLANGNENVTYDTIWVITHEIGHNVQQSRWTPSGLGQVTNDIFSQYVNEVVLNSNPHELVTLSFAIKFKEGGKKFDSLTAHEKQNILIMVKQECSWDTYLKFFKYYNEMPDSQVPKTKEARYSMMTKVLSEKCNKNLIPFFKWWNWPVTAETEEATKNLPAWDGIIEILNGVKKSAGWKRCGGADSGCCTAETPCEENDGDCDSDSDCIGDLVCGDSNCFWGDDDDCCQGKGTTTPVCKKEDDTDYYGFDIESKKTTDWKECADFCSNHKKCEVWSFRKSDGMCWIKNNNPYRVTRPGFLSGDRQCGGTD